MKLRTALLSWICVGCFSLAAQTSSPPPTLAGIVNSPGYKWALLNLAPARAFGRPTELILREGERSGSVEVLHIFPERGAVELRLGESNLVVALPGEMTNTAAGVPALAFAGVGVNSALHIYSELANRSLLRSPALPVLALTVRSLAGDKAEMANALSVALATNNIAIIPDGEKFALVVPKAHIKFFQPHSSELQQSAQRVAHPEPEFPVGTVMMAGADLVTTARFYAELSGRKINPAEWSPSVPQQANFFFKNQTALTKAEMLYAFEMLFQLYALKMIPKGDEFLEPVSVFHK